MKTDEIDVLAAPVLGNFQKIDQAEESGLSRQLRGDIREADRLNGIHFDCAFFHPVSQADFHTRAYPEANAAGDLPAPNAVPKPFRKHHYDEVYTRFVVGAFRLAPYSLGSALWVSNAIRMPIAAAAGSRSFLDVPTSMALC